MRVALIAPVDSSPTARVVAARLASESGVQLAGGLMRSITWRRFVAEIRRDGAVLLRKIWRAYALGSYQGDDPTTGITAALSRVGAAGLSFSDILSRAGAPLLRADDLNSSRSVAFLERIRPDVVVFTGGGLLRAPLLKASGAGVLNAHMGILPAYRGMDVIRWAILEHADPRPFVGVTTHLMDEGVDTGPILSTRPVLLRPGDTVESLTARFFPVMADMLVEGVRALRAGLPQLRSQQPEEGRQYFLMHPRLSTLVDARLRKLG